MSLNRIILQGRLGSDVELRTTPSGAEVATVSIAVDRDVKAKDGSRETDWITVVAWRQRAIFLSRYFTKGRMAVVEGRLQIRPYTDKEGNKRTAAEVVASSVYFGDSQRDGDSANTSRAYGQPDSAADVSADGFAQLDDDGDLPF